MFAFNTGLTKLFYAFEVIFYYFINNHKFVINICVGVLIVRLKIEKIRFIIEIYCLFNVNFFY